MKRTTHVKKHKRDGVVVEAHDRDIDVIEKDTLTDKIKSEKDEKSKRNIFDSILFKEE